MNIRKYSIQNGLVNNDILNIYQDSQGFIWLCTRGGLSRYDGSRFFNYTTENGLTNDMINDIIEIAPQEFIVPQNSNGPRFLKNGYIRNFVPDSNLTLNNFYKIGDKRFVATSDASWMRMWNNGNFTKLYAPTMESVHSVTMINDSVWLALQYISSIRLTNPEFRPLSSPVLLSATVAFNDSHHRTWVGTSHGLRLMAPFTNSEPAIHFVPLPTEFDLPILREAGIWDMKEDSRGNYWIGTSNGLVKINLNGESRIYTQKDGLPVSFVNCLIEDRQNNLWVGTTLGLAKMSLNNEIETFPLNFALSHDGTSVISPLTEKNWRLFDGRNIGNLNLDDSKVTNFSQLSSSTYWIYKLEQQQVLIVNKSKASIYHNWQEEPEHIPWPEKSFGNVARIDEDNFIASYNDTIYRVTGDGFEEKLVLGANSPVYCLLKDKKGFVWAGTHGRGLFKMQLSRGPSFSMRLVDTFINRIPDAHIRTMYSDKENELWIGTRYKGLVRLLEMPNGKYEIQNYGTRQGLSSDYVMSINRDSSGNIWVGTMQGIDKLIASGSHYRVFSFGKINSFFFPVRDIFFLRNNYLLTSSSPALMSAQDRQQDSLPAFPVFITKVFTGTEDTSAIFRNEAGSLPYDKAQVYFEFSSPQFINEEFSEYSYRLIGGNDTSWTISGKSHSVYFANLRPGNYRFEVRSLGFDGRWGKSAVYAFAVSTPFWQQPWFIVLIIVAIGALIYALYRYRLRQMFRLQSVRNRIATDLHDEIGSTLTNISILSNLSKKNLLQPQKATDFLQRISQEVASSSQALDDIIWSVNTNHDTLEETVARMRRYAAELFDAANIEYDLVLDPEFEERKLLMEQRRDIYLLYKEAVNNVSKHALAKKVSIQIAIEHNQLLLYIKDDGKGFDTGTKFNRHGLDGMKERVKKWKGKINIESSSETGTFVQISIPVSK